MTNEDTTADVPISNWTLATGTKPGARGVYSPRPGARLGMYSLKTGRRRSCATRAGRRNEQHGDSNRVMQIEDAMKARCLVVAMVLFPAT